MGKATTLKIAGFVVALGASAALVATAATGTGAYFTSSKPGNIAGSSGHIDLTTNPTDLNLNFTNLVPGVDQTATITFAPTADSSTNEDVWVVFDSNPADPGSTSYGQFTGAKGVAYGSGAYTGGGLGGYGHFRVAGDQGYGFESYNLQLLTATSDQCSVDWTTGDGGSSAKASGPDNGTQSAPECGVPGAIKVGSNIPPGQAHTLSLTFGLTGKATAQNTGFVNVPYTLVATQVGISPTTPNF